MRKAMVHGPKKLIVSGGTKVYFVGGQKRKRGEGWRSRRVMMWSRGGKVGVGCWNGVAEKTQNTVSGSGDGEGKGLVKERKGKKGEWWLAGW